MGMRLSGNEAKSELGLSGIGTSGIGLSGIGAQWEACSDGTGLPPGPHPPSGLGRWTPVAGAKRERGQAKWERGQAKWDWDRPSPAPSPQEPYTDGAFLRKHYALTAALFPALRFVAPHLRGGAVGEGRRARPLGRLVRVGFVSR